MNGGKVVVRFGVLEATKGHADLAIQQTPIPRVPETQCEISIPKVPGFEARERSWVGSILRGGKPSLNPEPPDLTLDADDKIIRGLIVAAKLTAGHAATGSVVEGAEFGWKCFQILGTAGRDGSTEVVLVATPAISGVYADVAAGPTIGHDRRNDRRLYRHVGGKRRASGYGGHHRDTSQQKLLHDVPPRGQTDRPRWRAFRASPST